MRTLLAVACSVLFLSTSSVALAEEGSFSPPESHLTLKEKVILGTVSAGVGLVDLTLLSLMGPAPSAGAGVVGFFASAGLGFLLILTGLPVLLLWLLMRTAHDADGNASSRDALTRGGGPAVPPAGAAGAGQTR